MVRLMQVGERLHNYTIGLLEPPRAFRFCSAAPAPHAKPCHDTSVPLSSTLTSLAQAAAKPFCLTAHQSVATEQLSRQHCKHLSQMTEMPNDGRAARLAMCRIKSIARSNFVGSHPVPSNSYRISLITALGSPCRAPAVLAAMRHKLFACAERD